MNNEDLKQAFEDTRQVYFEAFAQVKSDNVEEMCELRRGLQALETLQTILYSAIRDGKVEASYLELTKPKKEESFWTRKR